jgi:hypothetical protein
VRLRTRLWLVLGGLFLVPLVVGGLVLLVVVPDARSERVTDTVRSAGAAVSAEVADSCRLLGAAGRAVVLEAAAGSAREAVGVPVRSLYADYAAVLGPDGDTLAEAGELGDGVADPAGLASCSGGDPGGAALAEQAGGEDDAPTAVLVANLDDAFVDQLRLRSGLDGEVVLISQGRVVASTLDAATARAVARAVDGPREVVDVAGWTVGVQPSRAGMPYTVAVAVPDVRDGPLRVRATPLSLWSPGDTRRSRSPHSCNSS